VQNAVFTQNRALSGGGLSVRNTTTLYVTGSTFDSNQAEIIGGAFFADTLTTVSVDQSQFLRNKCGSKGGAVSLAKRSSSTAATASRIFNNVFTGSITY
jgi:predicted outer membrane repeat protein